ncbi:hypothetical protein COU53_03430 [Candidatus Pacearchaeota archaeon CG10_big_fil_rev_8_21_14_0_10_30_48]|nr:MAG: hypothetical protein COU53_03430 [Candidatus Pacearchaeota archaeon CG10_big_fil_rev_8_21_14_0_10_30_48]
MNLSNPREIYSRIISSSESEIQELAEGIKGSYTQPDIRRLTDLLIEIDKGQKFNENYALFIIALGESWMTEEEKLFEEEINNRIWDNIKKYINQDQIARTN